MHAFATVATTFLVCAALATSAAAQPGRDPLLLPAPAGPVDDVVANATAPFGNATGGELDGAFAAAFNVTSDPVGGATNLTEAGFVLIENGVAAAKDTFNSTADRALQLARVMLDLSADAMCSVYGATGGSC